MPEPKRNREDFLAENEHLTEEQRDHLWLEEQAVAEENPKAQHITDHLDDLRNNILISLVAIFICTIIAFNFSGDILKFLETAAPPGSTFFQLKPGELFINTLKVAFLAGLAGSLPFVLHQVYLFLAPGLEEDEDKLVKLLFVLAPTLFYTGVAFAFYLVLPPLLEFLLGFKVGIVEANYGLEHFINLEISILGLCGLCFQVPILLILLKAFKILDPKSLWSSWRYAVMLCFIVSAILTPTPDPFTMSILAISILLLYFGTIAILCLV